MTISTLPPAPSRADAANADTYSEIADTFVAALPVFSTQVNDTLTTVNAAAMSAIASANFKGAWSSLSGAMNVPASALHNDTLWLLVTNTTDITADVPGVSAKWINLSTYSGYVALTGDQTITGNKTFTGILQTTSPSQATVGAVKTGSGASNAFLYNDDSAFGVYDNISGALIHKLKSDGSVTITGDTVIDGTITGDGSGLTNVGIGNNQTWQSVTRSENTTYQNTTGKTIATAYRVIGNDGEKLLLNFNVGTSAGTLMTVFVYTIAPVPGQSSSYTMQIIIPKDYYYSFSVVGGGLYSTYELR